MLELPARAAFGLKSLPEQCLTLIYLHPIFEASSIASSISIVQQLPGRTLQHGHPQSLLACLPHGSDHG
eukprot:m.88189 g.88189  ORF g.88189 m.88189 type:complete len:69 (+) comp14814_c0_seq1:112-318(+)